MKTINWGKHQTNATNAQQLDLLWLLLRHHQRPRLVCDTNLVTQRNSHLSGDDQCLGKSDSDTPMISNELHTGEKRPSLDQCIPVWRAYNSEIYSEEHSRHEQHEALDNSHTYRKFSVGNPGNCSRKCVQIEYHHMMIRVL